MSESNKNSQAHIVLAESMLCNHRLILGIGVLHKSAGMEKHVGCDLRLAALKSTPRGAHGAPSMGTDRPRSRNSGTACGPTIIIFSIDGCA